MKTNICGIRRYYIGCLRKIFQVRVIGYDQSQAPVLHLFKYVALFPVPITKFYKKRRRCTSGGCYFPPFLYVRRFCLKRRRYFCQVAPVFGSIMEAVGKLLQIPYTFTTTPESMDPSQKLLHGSL